MKCNWDCVYCGFNEKGLTKTKTIDEDFILEKIEYIFSKYADHYYNVSGGEPGLMSEYFFIKLIDLIKKYKPKYISIETNGEIFKYDVDFSVFDRIRYHAIIDISINDDIKYLDFPESWNVIFIIVFTKNMNFNILEKHLMKYKNYYQKRKSIIQLTFAGDFGFLIKLIRFIQKMRKENLELLYKHLNSEGEMRTEENIIECKQNLKNVDISFSTDYIALCTYFAFLDERTFPITNENLDIAINGDFCIHHEYCKKCTKLTNTFNPNHPINKLTFANEILLNE